MLPGDQETEVLERALSTLDLALDPDRMALLARFHACLLQADRGLSAVRDRDQVLLKHIVDSLTCLLAVSPTPGQSLVDIGSGAGLPGLPLAIAVPGLTVTLVEATKRKSDWLRRTVSELGLTGVEVVSARAETVGQGELRERFDVAVCRAVAALAVIAEYALPLIRVGGTFVAMKGPAVVDELAAGEKAIARLGGGSPRVVEFRLPVLEHRRALVVAGKLQQTPRQYPRRAGVPARRPLG